MSHDPSEPQRSTAAPRNGLRIPTSYRRAFEAIAQLADVEQKALLDVVQTQELLSTTELARCISAAGQSLTVPPEDVLDAIFSLIAERGYLGWSDEELPDKLSRSRDLDLDDESRARLAELLGPLLDADAIALAAKATDVLSEHENVFLSSRVLTDIRPIFPRDDSMAPAGAGLVNMLKIEFLNDAGSDSIYFALDEDDLLQFIEVLDRASRKTEALREWLHEAGMTYRAYNESKEADADVD
jgi:hypothetical protein